MAPRDAVITLAILFGISMMVRDVNADVNIQPQPKKFFYLEKDQQKMVETLEAKHKNESTVTLACYRFGKKKIIETMLQKVPPELIKVVNKTEMNFLLKKCSNFLSNTTRQQPEGGTPLSGTTSEYQYIYPGTKWCGPGNVAEHFDDLGSHKETDLCCRDHDSCNDTIESKKTKYGLTNTGDYTRSLCDCDQKFRKCLKKSNTRSANNVGKIFFNKIVLQCFKMDHPIIGCRNVRKHWVFFTKKESCEDYDFDKNLPPTWQFFDPKYYE